MREATRKAIQGLKRNGVEITAKTLADASGRSFRAILRNKEAYELYRQSASHFKKAPLARVLSRSSRRTLRPLWKTKTGATTR